MGQNPRPEYVMPPQRPDEIGRFPGYRILNELAKGGMGVVYKAERLRDSLQVALKAMRPEVVARAKNIQRISRG